MGSPMVPMSLSSWIWLLMCLGCRDLKWWSMGPFNVPLLLFMCSWSRGVHNQWSLLIAHVVVDHKPLGHGHPWVFNFMLMDVSYVGRTESSIYWNTLLVGAVMLVSPLSYIICSQILISNMVKTHYWGVKIVVTLYCFLEVPCLNFNHVIIMKDFHNVFAYYGRSKPK